MRVYDGELCDCGCSLMETVFGLFCPECGRIVYHNSGDELSFLLISFPAAG